MKFQPVTQEVIDKAEGFDKSLLLKFFKHGSDYVHGKTLFELRDTYGLPFQIVFDAIKAKGLRPDMGGLRALLKVNYGWDDDKIDLEFRD